MSKKKDPGFSGRGGWWVAAQFALFALIVAMPRWIGQEPLAGGRGELMFVAGILTMVAGVVVSVLGGLTLGKSLTPYPRPLAKSALRTTGMYAWVRHPIYSGIVLATLGWALYHRSVAMLVWVPVLLLFFDRKAAREEVWLSKKFPGYAAYRRRVRKLVPGIY
ncbi:MAG: isoprenylcysteine carboxylmethyltransferase family protein [Gammaproteobacteria bacterium]|nr:isoprenylcysteine carboxylmethyltransferase family protein [Gammaproteobacteria bacterium]